MNIKQMKRKVDRSEDIATVIKTGVSHVRIEHAENATAKQVKDAYVKLLENHVLDKELLDLLTQEQNINKLKTRFEHRATLKTGQNNTIGVLSTIGKKTTNQVLNELKKAPSLQAGKPIKDTYRQKIDDLRNLGYTYEHDENGVYHSITLDIIFRKG